MVKNELDLVHEGGMRFMSFPGYSIEMEMVVF